MSWASNVSRRPGIRAAVIREHRELIDRIREQDADGAAAVVTRHVEGSGRHIVEQMGMARPAAQPNTKP